MLIKIEEMFFYGSSKESVISFLGDIGKEADDGYLILEDDYNIDTSFEKLLEFTLKHEVKVVFINGKIILS